MPSRSVQAKVAGIYLVLTSHFGILLFLFAAALAPVPPIRNSPANVDKLNHTPRIFIRNMIAEPITAASFNNFNTSILLLLLLPISSPASLRNRRLYSFFSYSTLIVVVVFLAQATMTVAFGYLSLPMPCIETFKTLRFPSHFRSQTQIPPH